MCGRFAFFSDLEHVSRVFQVEEPPSFPFSPRYNIAPAQNAPVVHHDGLRRLDLMRWGLVPFWAKEMKIGNRLINARAETVMEKPAFRDAFRRRRLVIPADGYYEWKRGPTGSLPHFIRRADGRLLALAGLWESWRRDDDKVLHTFCIITVPSQGAVRRIHDRMPLLIAPEHLDSWLRAPPGEAARLLEPGLPAELEVHRVSPAVNNPGNDGPGLLDPVLS